MRIRMKVGEQLFVPAKLPTNSTEKVRASNARVCLINPGKLRLNRIKHRGRNRRILPLYVVLNRRSDEFLEARINTWPISNFTSEEDAEGM